MTKFIALLRGINVGGRNIIKMVDLKTCFESMGFSDVITYIQSGNVIFTSDFKDKKELAKKIEETLSKEFSYKSLVVLVTYEEIKEAIKKAPENFGADPENYRYDVVFLKEPLKPEEAIKNISTKEGVDKTYKGKGVLYFSRLISKASQSYLSKIVKLPAYQSMTMRNWNTSTKLLSLMEDEE